MHNLENAQLEFKRKKTRNYLANTNRRSTEQFPITKGEKKVFTSRISNASSLLHTTGTLGYVSNKIRTPALSSMLNPAPTSNQTSNNMSTSNMLSETFEYEKILAQKMQSLRYQCKLHLQLCAIMS